MVLRGRRLYFPGSLAVCVIPFIPADLVKNDYRDAHRTDDKEKEYGNRGSRQDPASMDFDSVARINKNAPDQSSGAFLLHCISIISSVDQF